MSRNFDLMTQLDVELHNHKERPQVAAARGVVTPFASGDPGDVLREETLQLVQRIFFSANKSAPRQVVFCGVDGDNGSNSVCASVSRALATNSSQSVCIVDADIRSHRLSDLFGVNTKTPFSGTSELLLAQCVKVGSTLWLAGPEILADGNGALLPFDDLKQRFAELRDSFEYVLIAAPGANVSGSAQLLGKIADAVILIIEANGTRRLAARKARESLETAGVRLLGTVLNNRSFPIPEGLYSRL